MCLFFQIKLKLFAVRFALIAQFPVQRIRKPHIKQERNDSSNARYSTSDSPDFLTSSVDSPFINHHFLTLSLSA